MSNNGTDDSYDGDIADLAAQFYDVAVGPDVDRTAAIHLLDVIGRLVSWRSLELADDDNPGGVRVDLYGGMEVYGLLEQGWGCDLYSGHATPDRFDEVLFASLLAVMQAADRVMAPAADFNKRAYGAFGAHALNQTGRCLVDEHVRRLSWWVQLADEQAGQRGDR